MRLLRAVVGVCVTCASFHSSSLRAQQPAPEVLGRTFLEAEAKNWIKVWLDSHPPAASLTGMGGKTVFAIELLMAADQYRRADTDKGRFHAAASGAAAYVAYSYSATPAVGFVVTAVYLCAQIVEGAIAGSYAEAMLQIQKKMLRTETIRQDLVFRYGLSRAYRVIVLSQGLTALLSEGLRIDYDIQRDCKSLATDYDALANCMDLITRSMAVRASLRDAIARVMLLPDKDLDLLAATQSADGSIVEAPVGAQRVALQNALTQAEKNLTDMRAVYDPMTAKFALISAALLTADALDEATPFIAREQIVAACLAKHTRLTLAASTTQLRLASALSHLSNQNSVAAKGEEEAGKLRLAAVALLQEFEQGRVTCPSIREDAEMLTQFDVLRTSMAAPIK